jgi:uncharacterized membrane protein YccF (DUF307 family)
MINGRKSVGASFTGIRTGFTGISPANPVFYCLLIFRFYLAPVFDHSNTLHMDLIGNLIWLIFGGLWAALGYIVGGFVLCVTIVGIPWGLQCFKLAGVVLWPFGKQIVSKPGGSGCLSLFCNIIWLLCGGLYTAFVHLVFAFLLLITIIGIPFARQHLKLMELSFMPFSKNVIG